MARRRASSLEEDEGLLCIRPTAARLYGEDGEDHHLVGTVADVAFRGRGFEQAVLLHEGTQISSVSSDLPMERGALVGLRPEAAGCSVFGVAAAGVASAEAGLGPMAAPGPPRRGRCRACRCARPLQGRP